MAMSMGGSGGNMSDKEIRFGQAVWLARYDVARRTVRMGGSVRFGSSDQCS